MATELSRDTLCDAFRHLARPLAGALLLCAEDGTVLAANPAALRLLESDEDLMGARLHDWLGEPPAQVDRQLQAFAASTQRTPARLTVERRGVCLPLRVHGARVPHRDGYLLLLQLEPVGGRHSAFRLLNEEIAALRREQRQLARDKADLQRIIDARTRELARRERLHRTLLETVDQAIIAIDRAGRIRTFNRAAESIFGYPAAEMLGAPVTRLMPPELAQQHREGFARYLETGESRLLGQGSREVVGRHRDGHDIPLEITLAQADDEEGPLFVAALRDITESKRQAARLARHLAELERINRELDQFAYVTSHDLKAPLRAIANLASWIEEDLEDKLDDENRRQLELLRGRVRRMEALIEGLLAYSRIGRTPLKPQQVAVDALLEEVVDSLDPPPGFQIRWGPMPVLRTDPLRLTQVFANLVGNAIKYHHDPAHGHVWIEAEDLGETIAFTVTDDGPGIDPRFHDKIFQIFQTLQSRDTVESTGIGLTLVKKIVEEAGGRIEVHSAVGEGARFRFTWPKETTP